MKFAHISSPFHVPVFLHIDQRLIYSTITYRTAKHTVANQLAYVLVDV